MAMTRLFHSLPVALGVSIAFIFYGLSLFYGNWEYSEDGHEYLALIFVLMCVALFFALRLAKGALSIVSLIFIIGLLIYSGQKFDWRESYVTAAQAGHHFALDAYIDSYPTFEQHNFAGLLGEPQWVNFSKTCYEPLLKAEDISRARKNLDRKCKTAATIREAYNVDIADMVNNYYRRMTTTARQIERERFRTKEQFAKCIQDKRCAMIPLLPEGVQVSANSRDFLEIRNQFWSLINDKTISAANCDFFDFCRVMRAADLYKIRS